MTPLADPNLGLLPHAPILVAAAVVGLWQESRRTVATIAVASMGLLVVFAAAGNVNHGGTPGMSRYALWLLALSTPLLLAGCEWWRTHHRTVWRVAAAVSMASGIFAFRPAWADRAGDSANGLASTIWTEWPAIDNPLPEVFAERTSGSVRDAFVPTTTRGCEKVLIRGDGRDAWWPLPCVAHPAPDVCTEAGALCYVNNGEFANVPPQPAFQFEAVIDHAWTLRNMTRFDSLLRTLGTRPRFVRLTDQGGRIEDVQNLEHLYIVEGAAGAAAWVRSVAPPEDGSIRVNVGAPSTLEFLDASTLTSVSAPVALAPGTHDVPLATTAPVIVLVSDR